MHSQNTVNVLFILEEIEYARGRCSQTTGYLAFITEAAADKFIDDDYRGRETDIGVPNWYINYNKIGYKESDAEMIALTVKQGYTCIDRLSELK